MVVIIVVAKCLILVRVFFRYFRLSVQSSRLSLCFCVFGIVFGKSSEGKTDSIKFLKSDSCERTNRTVEKKVVGVFEYRFFLLRKYI